MFDYITTLYQKNQKAGYYKREHRRRTEIYFLEKNRKITKFFL